MDRTGLEARLSHVAAVRHHLPDLADTLEALGLMAAEDPSTNVVALWKEHDGPRLTAPGLFQARSCQALRPPGAAARAEPASACRSTSFVSCRNRNPMTAVISATTIGYHRP